MSRLSILFALCFFCMVSLIAEDPIKGPVKDSFQYFMDEENPVIYIDFEDIDVDVSEILIMNEENEEVGRKLIRATDEDSIIELDYTAYKSGTYQIMLVSKQHTLTRWVNFSDQ